MKIIYGVLNYNIDITQICYDKLLVDNIITIPSGDSNRSQLFTDPIIGVEKKIFIVDDSNCANQYEENLIIQININNKTVTSINNTSSYNLEIYKAITFVQSKLQLKHGSFHEELPEQLMAIRYLRGNEKVLEIGSNIGRNSLIIGFILRQHNNNNFVTLESNLSIAQQLKENRDINNMNFFIENSALSKRKLIQKGWSTFVSNELIDGFEPVNIINYDDLQKKYNIVFDTLVLDCEGAFYYILMDMPEILNNINLIIMENDYFEIEHKQFVDNILKSNNFYVEYIESGGWGPCYNNFYEVWKKMKNNS